MGAHPHQLHLIALPQQQYQEQLVDMVLYQAEAMVAKIIFIILWEGLLVQTSTIQQVKQLSSLK